MRILEIKTEKVIIRTDVIIVIFSIDFGYMAKAGTGADTTEHYLQTRFDYVYTMMLGYGLVFLLPCLIGIIAAILFFIERDCDTSKNIEQFPLQIHNLLWQKFPCCLFSVLHFV